MFKYDYIIPFGVNCFCEALLRHYGLFGGKTPFSFVHTIPTISFNYYTGRKITGRLGVKQKFLFLKNNFKDYFNKEDLIFLHDTTFLKNEKIIHNKKSKLNFYHLAKDYLTINDYDFLKLKMDNYINNFYKNLSIGKNLFIFFGCNWWGNHKRYCSDEILNLEEKLEILELYSNADYLYLEHDPSCRTFKQKEISSKITIIKTNMDNVSFKHVLNTSNLIPYWIDIILQEIKLTNPIKNTRLKYI